MLSRSKHKFIIIMITKIIYNEIILKLKLKYKIPKKNYNIG
jgi:hypothetical protein